MYKIHLSGGKTGMTPIERSYIYDKVFQLLVDCNITTLPVQLEKILDFLDVGLIPLSRIIRGTGCGKEEIFKLWGNRDGHLMTCAVAEGYLLKIAYNDLDFSQGRTRFTISEEIAHILLGHYKDDMYRINAPVPWYDEIYQQHEKQARLAAGLILCPPPVFYQIPQYLTVQAISGLCSVTPKCSKTSLNVLFQYQLEIQGRNSYTRLNNQFLRFVSGKRCLVCRREFIRFDTADRICDHCHKEDIPLFLRCADHMSESASVKT